MTDQQAPRTKRVAIVGGGIAGLFVAYLLKQQQEEKGPYSSVSFDLFEASERLGGRIRTVRFDSANCELGPFDPQAQGAAVAKQDEPDLGPEIKKLKRARGSATPDGMEFHAEFGPMRLELDSQRLLGALLHALGFRRAEPGKPATTKTLEEFPAYASPNAPHDPTYPLAPDEMGKSPMELFELALLRILNRLRIVPDASVLSDLMEKGVHEGDHRESTKRYVRELRFRLKSLREDAARLSEMGRTPGGVVRAFARAMSPPHLWLIQTCGYIGPAPLFTVGFWNLISDQLSHNAVRKIRELGSFYHLMDENPNAAEWFAWWLAGLSISDKLVGVAGGMETIVETLVAALDLPKVESDQKVDDRRRLFRRSKVKSVQSYQPGSAKLRLSFASSGSQTPPDCGPYDNIIFAIPKRPLQQILLQSLGLFNKDASLAEGDVIDWLDTAFDFPLVKVFGILHRRWWEEDFRPNFGATQMPTRELHYWKGATEGSRQGMVMVYTDRPSSALWSNFVASGRHEDVWKSPRNTTADEPAPANQFSQRQRLRSALADYLRAAGAPDVGPEDLEWVGIRDWGRDPYGGNHAWRPKRRYWYVMRQMADMADKGRIHVCGEAYSDYHGFIEGPLRSAVLALSAALDETPRDPKTRRDTARQEWPRISEALLKTLQDSEKRKHADESDASGRLTHVADRCLTEEIAWWVRSVASNDTLLFADEKTGETYLYGYKRYVTFSDRGTVPTELELTLSSLDECETCEERQGVLGAIAAGSKPESFKSTREKIEIYFKAATQSRKKAVRGLGGTPEDVVMLHLLVKEGAQQAGPELVERVFRDARISKHTRSRLAIWRRILATKEWPGLLDESPVRATPPPPAASQKLSQKSDRGLKHR